MSTSWPTLALAFALLTAVSSCSDDPVARKQVISHLYEPPTPRLSREVLRRWNAGEGDYIVISPTGDLSFIKDGARQTNIQPPEPVFVAPERPHQLSAQDQEYVAKTIFVSAHRDAGFGTVLRALSKIEDAGPYVLMAGDVDFFSDRLRQSAADELLTTGFAGEIEPQHMGILAGYSPEDDRCDIAVNGKAVSPSDLRDATYDKLADFVDRNGGAATILANPTLLESLISVIQADADTPWRCVARAHFWSEPVGWPFVRFEAMDGTATVADRPN